jgi:hypothetical protein
MQQILKNKVSEHINITFWYLALLVLSGLLYVISCAPAVLWQDSGLFTYRILHNDLEGNLGLALAHPLYILIGIAVKSIPFGDLAHRINLISSVAGAITIANLFLIIRLWINKTLPAIIGAITLAVSWNFWQHAAIAEVYTLAAAQITGELIVLLLYIKTTKNRYLYLLGLLNGLTIANHLLGVFGFACYTIFLSALLYKKQITLKNFIIAVLLWIAGAAPYEYLVLKNIILSGDIQGTLSSAFFGSSWQGSVLNTSISKKIILENIIFILLNFPTPNLILLFAGIAAVLQMKTYRSFANIMLALLVLYFIFAFR